MRLHEQRLAATVNDTLKLFNYAWFVVALLFSVALVRLIRPREHPERVKP